MFAQFNPSTSREKNILWGSVAAHGLLLAWLLHAPEPQLLTPVSIALGRNGNAVGYFLFSGEQHGFRQAANIQRCLDAELAFYAVEVFRIGLTF